MVDTLYLPQSGPIVANAIVGASIQFTWPAPPFGTTYVGTLHVGTPGDTYGFGGQFVAYLEDNIIELGTWLGYSVFGPLRVDGPHSMHVVGIYPTTAIGKLPVAMWSVAVYPTALAPAGSPLPLSTTASIA